MKNKLNMQPSTENILVKHEGKLEKLSNILKHMESSSDT